jgi:tRNA nucleotidyltransferase/poly(A) polymerase
VVFGRDWKADAERRDFTINALYARADGSIVDLVGGMKDIESRTLRFIGDAEARIREDYLRILRFFRFFAWYGSGRPDAEGLKACARLKGGLSRLSAERVWAELKKLLGARDPSRSLLWMRQAGVLTAVLPESEKWGIDAIHGLVAAERDLGWAVDPLLRLEAILPPDAVRMRVLAKRLKLSRAESTRLAQWAGMTPPRSDLSEKAFEKVLYRRDGRAVEDRLRLLLSAARAKALTDDTALIEAGGFSRLLSLLAKWKKPAFPLSGNDLLALGAPAGKVLGDLLVRLESEWIDSGFSLSREELADRAKALMAK